MKVVHVSTSDVEGGSARSAWRIHENIEQLGVDSRMLVGFKSSDSYNVDVIANTKFLAKADHFVNRVQLKLGMQYCYLPSQRRVSSHTWLKEASIIQLYNLHGGYFNLASLKGLSSGSRIVWRLSDLWPITGHCAYPGSCQNWVSGCGQCPDLDTYPGIGVDTTAVLWRRKSKIYDAIKPFTVVAPSSWTEQAARKSPLFDGCDIRRIPNGIDVRLYRERNQYAARRLLGIDDNRPAIFFCAHVAFDNPRKGTDFLQKVLNSLPNPKDYCFIVAGRESEKWVGHSPLDTYSHGFVDDDETLANLYAASDVVLIPSAVENLPNTAIEALSCKKPVVALDAGGMADVVRNGETGFCLPSGDVQGFVRQLHSLLSVEQLRLNMGQNGRNLIEKEFDEKVEAQRFVELYDSLLGLEN
ncbi:MAG: glycosyltransferase family 4 protein [Thalassospira sp.]|uniref:glycosyltransferase family 4 protein n=1 Tax=Thalassospira sp. TaxID=1912094 RepID=UPI003A888EE0